MKRIQQACICQTLRFFLKDDFPKNTQLYRIMTTKPEETVQN